MKKKQYGWILNVDIKDKHILKQRRYIINVKSKEYKRELIKHGELKKRFNSALNSENEDKEPKAVLGYVGWQK